MLAKCANPSCSTPLVYLREGKIFMIESAPQSSSQQSSSQQASSQQASSQQASSQQALSKTNAAASLKLTAKAQNRVEHFWLCGPCSSEMTVIFEHHKGVQVVPKTLRPVRPQAS